MTINPSRVLEHLHAYLEEEYRTLKAQNFEEVSRMVLAKIDLMEKFKNATDQIKAQYKSVEESPYNEKVKILVQMTQRNQAVLTGMMEGLRIITSAFEKTNTIANSAGMYTADGSPYKASEKNVFLGAC